MGIPDFIVLAIVAFCLALAGTFWGHSKNKGGCSGMCSSCSMNCSPTQQKKQQSDQKNETIPKNDSKGE